MAAPLAHRVARMSGRDPDEDHRAATPLELLFDLTFVVAFGIAADELAHYLAEDHIRTSVLGFAFISFAISWAWINFSWFASAYDTDDWVFRLLTLVQMLGVLVLALGIADVFDSIDHADHVDNGVVVAGYVVMRVAMVAQWTRAARQDPERRPAAMTYVVTILVAQAGWVALAVAQTSVEAMFAWAGVLILVELAGPYLAETRKGGTPWHPHHIAERYGLLIIIALGEAILGTIAALGAIVGPEGQGWSVQAAVVGLAGVALTFGMWWIYFVVPCGEVLEHRRERSFGWGYGHIPLFASVVAAGRRPARGRVPGGAPHRARRARHAADDRDPGGGVRARDLPALHVPERDRRPVPLPADRALGRGPGRRPGDGRARRGLRVVPARGRRGALGHGDRLRDGRAPPQRPRTGRAGGAERLVSDGCCDA